jgi:hypothetical protein
MTSVTTRIAVGAGIAFMAAGANAAVLDFSINTAGFTVESQVGVGAPNFVGGGITSEAGFTSLVIDADGEDLDIVISDPGAGNPYFDGLFEGRDGGLGSCRVLTGSAQCADPADDNLTISTGESIRMDFKLDSGATTAALFGDFLFRDNDHYLIDGTVLVDHDGGSTLISVSGGIGDLSVIGPSEFLTFTDGGSENYYISGANISAIPVPAAVWLFGSALGLLGWLRRKPAA